MGDSRSASLRSAPLAVVSAFYRRWQQLVHEVAKFGVVGAVNAVLDIGLFNLLHVSLGVGPLTSKAISTIVATTGAYIGNRYWAFRHRARTGLGREYVIFFVLNGVALGIALACLGFTYYALDLRGTLAVNISGNVVGLGLGTLFRFWAYRRWVFLDPAHVQDAVPIDTPSALAADWTAHHPHAAHQPPAALAAPEPAPAERA